jgi:hypothetical protein
VEVGPTVEAGRSGEEGYGQGCHEEDEESARNKEVSAAQRGWRQNAYEDS